MSDSKKTIVNGKRELAMLLVPELIKDSYNFWSQKLDKVVLTLFLISIPFAFRVIKRKKNLVLFGNKLEIKNDFLKPKDITRTMVENHEYIRLNLLKAVNIQRVKDKISYKEDQQVSETYIASTLASLFSRKSREKSISAAINEFEQNKNIVKVELACIHQPWPEEAIDFFNVSHLSKSRNHEWLVHSFDHNENVLKVWAFYKPRFWKRRRWLNIELIKNGHTRRNTVININPFASEELYDLITDAEKYEKQAKIEEKGLWSKYKSELFADRKYGEGKRVYDKHSRLLWLQSYLKF